MNPLADLSKSPILYKIGETTYEVSPLTQNDHGDFCRFVQYMGYYAMRDLPNMPPDAANQILLSCARTSVAVGSKEYNAANNNPDGQAELAFLSLRRKHPTITREQVKQFPHEDLNNISGLLTILANPDAIQADQKKMEVVAQAIAILKSQGKLM